MLDFLPFDVEVAKQFEEKMSKNLLYRSTDNFIAIYNNNLINRSNSEIDKVAKKVVEIYKNVSLVNRQFIVKSKEEVISDEFEVLFPHISFIATLKRIAKDILNENHPEDTKMIFTEENKNIVHIYDPSSESIRPYEGAERLKSANESIATNPFLVNIKLEPWGDEGTGISFKAIDVLTLDTSFIMAIGELLNKYTSNSDNSSTQDNLYND